MMKRRNRQRWGVWCAIILLVSHTALASIDDDLNHFFNGLGYRSNITTPTAFHDQAAGYYTGGSIFLRNRVRTFQLASIELPSFSGGCSGIDVFLGSFSLISADEALEMIKNILSSAGMYAFDLALTTVLPQARSVKDAIQSYITKINNANINACDTAEELVGGMWPKMQATQQQICRDVGSRSGVFADWARSRQGCGTGGEFKKGMAHAADRNRDAEVVVDKNLVWSALQGQAFLAADTELAELLMSLSGSIIIRIDPKAQEEVSKGVFAPKTQQVPLPPMAADRDMIKALLYGGSLRMYHCDETTRCLNPTVRLVALDSAHGLVNQVMTLINALESRVADDKGPLPDSVRGFLEMCPLPILKLITNRLSLGKAVNVAAYRELIAMHVLNQYLDENLRLVRQALSTQDNDRKVAMLQQLNETQALVGAILSDSERQLTSVNAWVDLLKSEEQQVTARLLNHVFPNGSDA